MSKKELIRTIKDLFDKGEPLNISAIKRNHPELIDVAYSITPFLGWKGALNKAGIDYSDIVMELTDFVDCQICGKQVRAVTNHALIVHGYSLSDYKNEFPEIETRSDLSKKYYCRFKHHNILPHWEPFWTPEYILDRIYGYYEKGYPLTYSAMATVDGGLGNIITKSKDVLGGWEEIVYDCLGLEPDQEKRDLPVQLDSMAPASRYPDGESVCVEIRRRVTEQLPITSLLVQRGEECDGILFSAARRIFGNWKKAVIESGVDIELLKPKATRTYPDHESVTLGIKLRAKQNLPLNHLSLVKGPNRDHPLIIYGAKYFGSWDKALESAGFDPTQIRKFQVRGYDTQSKVIEAIQERWKIGLPLNAGQIFRGPNNDSSLYLAGRKLFPSWAAALSAAGIDPKKVIQGSASRLGVKR